jgi:hypothetical protein
MTKWLAFSCIVMLAAVALFVGAFNNAIEVAQGASEAETGPAEIILQVPVGGGVFLKTLTHDGHVREYGIACKVCHHVFENGENVWEQGMPIQGCEECHSADSLGVEKEVVPGLLTKQLMSHESCKDCHKKS